MHVNILYRPAFSLAICTLGPEEAVCGESGAMVSMSGHVEVQTQMRGGFFSALGRKLLGGESFFVNTYVARGGAAEVTFAPPLAGDLVEMPLQGTDIIMTSGAYVASSPEVQIETKWGGARTFFSREGLFLLRAFGYGTVLFASYGAIHAIDLAPGQRYVVDTGHIVAFQSSVQWSVRAIGGVKSTLFSGEGLVCEYIGPGRLWLQTRSQDSFLSWLIPQLPTSTR